MRAFLQTAWATLQRVIPQHAISRLVHRVTRIESGWFKNAFIRVFMRLFAVDVSDAADEVPTAYPSFNAFFTRALVPGARPLDGDPDAILSPVDGQVSAAGHLDDGDRVFQAKGRSFSLRALLGGDPDVAARFDTGSFATIYLAPYNYHRIHMPCGGVLSDMYLVPGRLFSVDTGTTRTIDGLFARNERVVSLFDTPLGPLALVMVGALCVGSIETVWHGEVTPGGPRRPRHWHYDDDGQTDRSLARGAEVGRFNMGSTVILVFGKRRLRWEALMQPGTPLRVGQRIATPGDAGAH